MSKRWSSQTAPPRRWFNALRLGLALLVAAPAVPMGAPVVQACAWACLGPTDQNFCDFITPPATPGAAAPASVQARADAGPVLTPGGGASVQATGASTSPFGRLVTLNSGGAHALLPTPFVHSLAWAWFTDVLGFYSPAGLKDAELRAQSVTLRFRFSGGASLSPARGGSLFVSLNSARAGPFRWGAEFDTRSGSGYLYNPFGAGGFVPMPVLLDVTFKIGDWGLRDTELTAFLA